MSFARVDPPEISTIFFLRVLSDVHDIHPAILGVTVQVPPAFSNLATAVPLGIVADPTWSI
jgi:hypothetical protein